jgi:hypothetical protein
MLAPQRCGYGIDAPPLALPLDVPRPFQLTDAVFTSMLDAAGQLQAQHPVVEGIMGLGKVAFCCKLRDDCHRHVRPLLIAQPRHAMMSQRQ